MSLEEYVEWTGPSFDGNCARYRTSNRTVQLVDMDVPSKVEILNERGKWQSHPVVFINYGTYEALKNMEGTLVIFLPNRTYTSHKWNSFTSDIDLYNQAELLGLTVGDRSFIKKVVWEESD